MYLEISNPMDYHVALYIRLSKEDETEGPSQSVTNQKSLLNEFVQQHRLSVYDTYVDVYNQRLIPFDTKMAVKMIK